MAIAAVTEDEGRLGNGLQTDRQGQEERLHGEGVDERRQAVLIEQHEAHQHHAAGQEVGEAKVRCDIYRLPDTRRSNAARRS